MNIIKTKDVCAKKIMYDIEEGKLTNIRFIGGCSGNTQAISSLLEGMDADEAISRLEGIMCGGRGTSCGNELAKGLKEFLDK